MTQKTRAGQPARTAPGSPPVAGRIGGASAGTSSTTEGSLPGDPDWCDVVKRWHPNWRAADLRFRWLMDSYVAGERYSNGVYGYERDQYLPVRNLVRHPREYPDPQKLANGWYGGSAGAFMPTGLSGAETALGMDGMMAPFGPMPGYTGSDPHSTAHDDDYEYRRARTVPPNFVGEAVGIHLGKIYDQEVRRAGPDVLVEWWKDVDGRGTPMDDWVRERVAPLFLVFGCLDILFDHPRVPAGQSIISRADEMRLGLSRCVASYILPQNMVWWRLDTAGRYVCCLIREYADPSERYDLDDDEHAIDVDYPEDGPDEKRAEAAKKWRSSYIRWRYWNDHESVLLNHDGDAILERIPHKFGMVPILRGIHRPDPHADNMGLSEYETIARYMRAYYNVDSELILSDSLQAHPSLSGPEDFCKPDGTLSVGPGYILPKKKNLQSGAYEGWEFVSPPKDPAESIRRNKQDIRDAVDRDACLAKPPGAVAGTTTGQSGISKEMDAHTGHKKLRGITHSLAKFERQIAEYALMVATDTPLTDLSPSDREAIRVVYPAKFELRGAAELSQNTVLFQQILASSGDAPQVEGASLKALVRMNLPDLSPEEYAVYDAEIDTAMEARQRLKEAYREGLVAGISDGTEVEGRGTQDSEAGTDPLGQSSMTAVSGASSFAV